MTITHSPFAETKSTQEERSEVTSLRHLQRTYRVTYRNPFDEVVAMGLQVTSLVELHQWLAARTTDGRPMFMLDAEGSDGDVEAGSEASAGSAYRH